MLNRTLKILGIVVLLLITLWLIGVMEIKEYRSVDKKVLEETLREPSSQESEMARTARGLALDSKIYITTYYSIVIR